MKKWTIMALLLIVAAGSFLAGYLYSRTISGKSPVDTRKALYYADPMNPGYKSDKPGTAPCGMQLVPVYANSAESGTLDNSSLPPPSETVRVSPDRQQLIGLRVENVEKGSTSRNIRLLGKVASDETCVYRINAATDGWVRSISRVTTGSLVRKDELLGTYYAPEFSSALKAFFYGLQTYQRFEGSGKETKEQLELSRETTEGYRNSLRNLGMSEHQLDEISRTRKNVKDIEIRSPAAGFILARNLSLGQRFERGAELYRIGDLSRIWILVDTYENEARYFHPGQIVPVHYQGKTYKAKVSKVLPQFDPATRTLKVRLEADNQGYVLRPDMFVDVDLDVHMPPGITVPADAVLDSGLKKTVYVDRGNGFFEPRKVETGRWFDERVEIISGLMPGERIVVSGNFLLDSESRMRTASSGMSGTGSIDPSCGMIVDEGRSRAAGLTSEYRGKTYFFCSIQCKRQFDKAPQIYAGKPAKIEMQEKNIDSGGRAHESENGGHQH